jgi:hypothetical protein
VYSESMMQSAKSRAIARFAIQRIDST